MTARKHHYVPQCYLKGFVKDRNTPKLFVVDAKERRTFDTSPANVAAERDFHKIDVEGQEPDALENAFSRFESELSPAIERIIASRSIKNDEDRILLFNLIGLMATKNPRLRENFRDAHERTANIIMDLVTSTPQMYEYYVKRAKRDGFINKDSDVDYATMREFIEKNDDKLETGTMMHLQMELDVFDEILPMIFRRKWILFKAPQNTTGFVTSDHPMCLMWSDPPTRGGGYPPGLALRRTQLVFPISKELLIIGAFEAEDGEIDADDFLIAQINGRIILHATRQIYARDSEFLYRMQHNPGIMRGSELLKDQCFTPWSP